MRYWRSLANAASWCHATRSGGSSSAKASASKKPRARPSKIVLTSPAAAPGGSGTNLKSILLVSSSSMRRGQRPTWPVPQGWWRRGFPLRDQVPYGHWRTTTFLAALRHDRITAPCVIDGPINGESFGADVEQVLVPTRQPGDRRYAQSQLPQRDRDPPGYPRRRCTARLPAALQSGPQSIEQVFAKLKILLRKAEKRTIEGVWRRIGSLLQHFTSQECANYLRNAGYASI